jgi:hypothetical protein
MWLPTSTIEQVDRVAKIRYISKAECEAWNAHRREGELRLLTGWEWIARDGSSHCQGFKTETVCYRNAWYALIRKEEAPSLPTNLRRRTRLRLVAPTPTAPTNNDRSVA